MAKGFTFPRGLGELVLGKVLRWENGYNNGVPVDVRKVPHPTIQDLMETHILRTRHTIPFKYNELKWLAGTLKLEDSKTTQTEIFAQAVKKHEDLQAIGRAKIGVEWNHEFALTRDEVSYISLLLQRIRIGRATPSEVKEEKEKIEKADW